MGRNPVKLVGDDLLRMKQYSLDAVFGGKTRFPPKTGPDYVSR
jgi:hypothetical protein